VLAHANSRSAVRHPTRTYLRANPHQVELFVLIFICIFPNCGRQEEPCDQIGSDRQDLRLNTASLLWGLLFGSIGIGFLIYGRKQRAVVPLVCGLALMIFPYFLSNTILLVTVGIILIAIPYFFTL
jgi:hypothetical protein